MKYCGPSPSILSTNGALVIQPAATPQYRSLGKRKAAMRRSNYYGGIYVAPLVLDPHFD